MTLHKPRLSLRADTLTRCIGDPVKGRGAPFACPPPPNAPRP